MIAYLRTQFRRLFTDNTPIIRLFRNAGWLLSGDAITMGIGVVQGILIARVLGASLYGTLGLITTYALFVNQLVDSRVWETVIRYVTQFRATGDEARVTAVIKLSYLIDLTTGSLAFVLVLATAPLAAVLFVKDATLTPVIRLFAVSVLLAIPRDTSTALLRVNGRFRWLAYQNSGEAIFRLLGVIGVLALGGGITGLLVVYLVTGGVFTATMLGLVYQTRHDFGLSGWRTAPIGLLRPYAGEIGRFLLATNGNALLKMIRNSDVLLLGYLLNPTQVGYYRVARSLANFINIPVSPIYNASYPEFAALWQDKKFNVLKPLIKKVFTTTTVVAIGGGAVLLVFGRWLITLSVTDEFLPALPVLRWLAVGTAVAVATSIIRPLLLAANRANQLVLASILGILAQIIILVGLTPRFGISAAGMAYLVFYLIWSAVCLVDFQRVWTIHSSTASTRSRVS